MMKKCLILLLFFFCSSLLYSFPHEKKPGNCYIFANSAYVRSEPSEKGKVLTKINIGTSVEIIKRTDITFEYDDLIDYWYQVKVDEKITGYIWGGLLSNGSYFLDIDNDNSDELVLIRNFSLGGYSFSSESSNDRKLISDALRKSFISNETPDKLLIIRIIKNNKLFLTSTLFKGFGETKILDVSIKSIPGFESIPLKFLRISYEGEDHISGLGESYFFYNSQTNALVLSFNIFEGGEGGEGTEYKIVLPDDKDGVKNTFRTVITSYWGDGTGLKTSDKIIDYQWDGKTFQFIRKQ